MNTDTSNTPTSITVMETGAPAPDPARDMIDRTRRLSMDSDLSSYSVISEANSVHSLDSSGSANGGVNFEIIDTGGVAGAEEMAKEMDGASVVVVDCGKAEEEDVPAPVKNSVEAQETDIYEDMPALEADPDEFTTLVERDTRASAGVFALRVNREPLGTLADTSGFDASSIAGASLVLQFGTGRSLDAPGLGEHALSSEASKGNTAVENMERMLEDILLGPGHTQGENVLHTSTTAAPRSATEGDTSSSKPIGSVPTLPIAAANSPILKQSARKSFAVVPVPSTAGAANPPVQNKTTRKPLALVSAPSTIAATNSLVLRQTSRKPLALVPAPSATVAPKEVVSSPSSPPLVSHFWSQFSGFVPQPKASFKSEFNRLAKSSGWNAKIKKQRQIEGLKVEFDFHYGTCMTKLDHWQQLCKDVGVKEVPESITKCKKVSI
jgi:hypothetical protein